MSTEPDTDAACYRVELTGRMVTEVIIGARSDVEAAEKAAVLFPHTRRGIPERLHRSSSHYGRSGWVAGTAA